MKVYRLDIDPGETGKWGKRIRWGRIVGFISGSIHLVLGFHGQAGRVSSIWWPLLTSKVNFVTTNVLKRLIIR